MIRLQFHLTLDKRLREKFPLIQILLGPRQVGKTTAAQIIFDEWQGPKIFATADSPTPPTHEWIRHHWEQARLKGDGTVLILDEIQKVPGWSEMIKLLFDQDRARCDLRPLLLGSSSLYLQKGLRESLVGRFELVHAPHWSYRNFRDAFGWDFETYLQFGAYPGAVPFKGDRVRWRNYIQEGVIEPVLGKDILGLHPVNNPALFRQTFELAVHYPAQVVSFQKLLGQLQERGNASTIKNYLHLMEQSFLIKTVQKYTGSPLHTRTSSPKIVVMNQALIHAYKSQENINQDPDWRGRVFESILGAHLSQIPDSELYYWKEGQVEVDYILKTADRLLALEIKSGARKSSKGIYFFSKRYPKAHCETWDREKCLQFLEGSALPI